MQVSAQPALTTTAPDRVLDRAPLPARRVPVPSAGAVAMRPRPGPAQVLDELAGSARSPIQPPASPQAPAESGEAEPVRASGVRRMGLCAMLAETAHAHPQRIAFTDPADKPLWSDRSSITWTYAAAAEIVARLANGLRNWRLAPASRVGLSLGGGAESLLAYLAIEAAGHIPCLLPLAWDADRLVTAVQAAGVSAVLTQSRVGTDAPAERLCRVALHYFGLRYLAAFGPDVPDGVISLDAMALDGHGGPFASGTGGGLISFADGDPSRPVHRSADALLAACALYLVRARISPGDRILTLLPLNDLRAVVTGLGAAIVSGAGLETMPVFGAAGFAAAIARPVPTHLVAPAGLEPNLASSVLPDSLRSVCLTHRVPGPFAPRTLRPGTDGRGPGTVIDVIPFDETALLPGARERDDVAVTLADPEVRGQSSMLMGIRVEADGRLGFRGHACKAGPLQRDIGPGRNAEDWTGSPFKATVRAGRATALTRI